MSSSHVAARNKSVFTILCFSLGLFASSAAVSQEVEIEVVGGNSSNSLMFGLDYGVDDAGNEVNQAIPLNTDANQYPSLNSFTFVRNTCGEPRTDVVAASTNASRLVIYAGGQGDGTPIYEGGLGAGTPICGGTGPNACPPRPLGLSTSVDGKIAVATSGAAGTTPGVFTFTAGDGDNCGVFTKSGGRLSLPPEDKRTIRAIADTEFMREDVGGVMAGDLLVLVSNPAMIVHVPAGNIVGSGATGSATGSELPGSASVFSGYRRATPTGLAIVPGETPNILVTLSTGAIANFYLDGENWPSKPFDTGSLFPNPRGIGAGARAGVPYIVVSEQNRGRYIRQEVQRSADGKGLDRLGGPREIDSPVGAPEGVAVSQEDPNIFIATKCFNPESEAGIGCNFGPGDLHFSQGFEGGLAGERVRFDVQYIPDTGRKDGLLKLPYGGEQDFFVPATCTGYDIDVAAADALGLNNAFKHIVLVDIELLGDFSVTSGNFAQVSGRVKDTLGDIGQCTETGERVYYHPSKNLDGSKLEDPEGVGFTLFDITVSCQNPPRGISEQRSPVVFCVDPNYVARKTDPEAGRNEFVNPNIRIFIDDLKAAVKELNDDVDPELSSTLNSYLVGFTNPDNAGWKVPGYYVETWQKADAGAIAVLGLKREGAFDGEDLPSDLYGRLLRGFLGLAFYAKETGLAGYGDSDALAEYLVTINDAEALGEHGVKYYPPKEFCEPFNEYEGILYPELQDVKCDCTKVPSADKDNYQTCAP